MEGNIFRWDIAEYTEICLSFCSYLCSKCRDRGHSTFPPPLPGGWSHRAACGIIHSYRTVVMENDVFHEDGSSGGQRQTSLPWKFTQEKENQNWTLIISVAVVRGVPAAQTERMWQGNCRSPSALTEEVTMVLKWRSRRQFGIMMLHNCQIL